MFVDVCTCVGGGGGGGGKLRAGGLGEVGWAEFVVTYF